MKLLNFSIGRVETVQISGESVRTAHVKAPAAEPWVITPDGAKGDERAVHPDKLYAFARSAYRYWGEHLQVDPACWPDGFFGENLTVDTLDEDDVRIGDVFAIGEQVRVIVSGARTPCLKLAWRLNQPRSFQKTFALSRHTGAYFDVLVPGPVRQGDEIRCIRHNPAMPSIADVCRFVSSRNPPPLEELKRLLAFDKLSPALRLFLNAKLDSSERATMVSEGRWRGWRAFTIQRIVDEAPDIRSFTLHPKDGAAICQPRPGQFVTVRMTGAQGNAITRCWSLSEFSPGMESYRLTIRRQSGPGSNWMHQAENGATVMLRAPAGNFVLDMGSFRPVVLIAAGIGITPLFAMLQAQLGRTQGASVYLIYGARTPRAMAFRSDLQALAETHPNFHLTFVYSRTDDGGHPATRITHEIVTRTLSDLHVVVGGHRVDLPWHEGDFYLCGPGDFCRQLKEDLVARGANGDHIFFELFTKPQMDDTDVELAQVRFARSGLTCEWTTEDDLSLLELAEQAGTAVESDCRAGLCLTCRTAVLDGATTADMGDGTALLCIGRPKTHKITLDC